MNLAGIDPLTVPGTFSPTVSSGVGNGGEETALELAEFLVAPGGSYEHQTEGADK